MKTHLLRQYMDINPLNGKVINACTDDLLVQNQSIADIKEPISIERFLKPAIYQYYTAYSSFLNLGKNTLAPPEMIEVNEAIYMVEASSRHLHKETSILDTLLRIEFNSIKIEDDILHLLDSEQIFKRRANKIQLKAAYEQIHLLLDEKSEKIHNDIDRAFK